MCKFIQVKVLLLPQMCIHLQCDRKIREECLIRIMHIQPCSQVHNIFGKLRLEGPREVSSPTLGSDQTAQAMILSRFQPLKHGNCTASQGSLFHGLTVLTGKMFFHISSLNLNLCLFSLILPPHTTEDPISVFLMTSCSHLDWKTVLH